MSKWRPHKTNCIYVIPDIHGMYNELEVILKRILPLRRTDGCKDTLVFLGDYVDRYPDAHLVIDKLIELKNKYKEQVICIRGNHEDMFMDALKPSSSSQDYLFWMKYGGEQTLKGYLERADIPTDNPYEIQRQRIPGIIPKEHVEFIENMDNYYETEDFIFVHAGCNPNIPLDKQDPVGFRWDRSVCSAVTSIFGDTPLPWKKQIITGHNGKMTRRAVFKDKFVMLDESHRKRLLVMEARTREVFVAQRGKKRLVDFNILK